MNATTEEIARAEAYLDFTRDGLIQAVKGFDDAQWHFKPTPGQWSAAENVEHLALIEGSVKMVVGRMPDAPAAGPDRIAAEVDASIIDRVPNRSTKVSAPPHILPQGRWSPAEGMRRFLAGRAETVRLLREAPCLRGHVIAHPVLGPWDGYQWLIATAAHTIRHTRQIMELKGDGAFPAVDSVCVI